MDVSWQNRNQAENWSFDLRSGNSLSFVFLPILMLFFHQYRCCFVRYCGPTMHSSQGVPQIHPKVDHLQKKLFSHHSNCIRLSYCVQTSISDLFPLRQRRDNSPIPSSSIRQLLIESLTLCRFLGTVSPNFARKSLSAHSFGLFQASHCHLGPFSRGVYS